MKKFYSLIAVLMCLCTTKAFAIYEKIDGTTVWGYYTADNLDDKDVIKAAQVQDASVDLTLGIEVPGYGALNGSVIQAINVPINKKSELSKFYVFIMDADKETVLYEQKVDVSTFTDWALNTVKLDTPFTLDRDVLVGMRFHGTSVNGGASVQCILTAKSYKLAGAMWYKETTKWYDLHDTYGALPIQLQVSGAVTGDMMAYFSRYSNYTAPDSRVVYNATVNADCATDVTDITYTVTVDGKSETYDAEVPISAGQNQSNQVEVMFHSPAAAGPYDVQLTIDKINGGENALAKNVAHWTMTNVTRKVERKTVMEEYTGTWCGNCPRGIAGVKTLKKYYPDNFIPVSYHYGASSYPDKMTVTPVPNNTGTFPTCQLDRDGYYIDPFYGSYTTDHTCEGIVMDFAACQEVIPTIDVTADPYWTDATMKKITVKANVEALAEGTYQVVYVLTADSLYNASWVQTNYCYQYTQDQWHGNDFFGEFCSGGIYGQEYLQIPYDEVVIGHSYKTVDSEIVNQGETTTLQMGETYQGEYTITLPTSTDFYDAIMASKDKVYAVVMVLNAQGEVANACKVAVPAYADAVNGISANGTQEVARYTLDGRRATAGQRGPVIVKYADGKSRVVVK